ncbi:Lrp/AsnC family transcriptional regulator [Streptomyces sp. ASQP_92]|uniref:Lrp/AsnC family transcriptional regulator n=1 Tax=Streptomyces sp. ASQP_92 TaxID=2979116 RepID=UPI0021C0E48F|nr:Lrp/AsnC family transcriptional regulator [Streptomyces sp. ASQP_92]MCT9093786.1 Lrp/AsnC family transcriptional regulator [Streptomyces sp. ASQP_92]
MANFDEINRGLLLELQKNARRSNRELARALGIADSTCLERVRGLQQNEVILGYTAEVNLDAMGRGLRAMIAVRIHPKSRDAVESFREFVLTLTEVLDVFVVSGSNDFQVLVAVQDAQHLEDFVLDHIAQYPSVADLSASLVYEHLRRRPVDILQKRPPRRRRSEPPS